MKISKSRYLRGFQCPKMIWLDINTPELGAITTDEATLETGNEVGALAREYFGKCTLVEYNSNPAVMAASTKSCMTKEQAIAEATFIYDNLFCSVDILKKNKEGYELVEVKSSTGVDEIHLHDLAFQYYVLTNAGINVTGAYLMHINSSYVRQGELDLEGLFTIEDLTEDIILLQDTIPVHLAQIRKVMKLKNEPKMEIGLYCDVPYECAYQGYCRGNIPSPSIFDISRLSKAKKYSYFHQGIISYKDIIDNEPKLSDKQWLQVESAYYHYPPTINKKGIKEFLKSLTYPLYFLDFETFQQAIPKWDGVSPYMQIPFQYSLHVQHKKGGPLDHFEYLGEAGKDPRRKLAEQLCREIPLNVCSLAYNMGFEKGVIKRLAEIYPDLSDHLMNIHDNMHDLMVPFQQQYYYSKELQGSYSIKYVLPAVCPEDPELDYHNLEGIHNGGEAMTAYAMLTQKTPEEIEQTRKNLLAYCGLDTLAMVKVLEQLYIMEDL